MSLRPRLITLAVLIMCLQPAGRAEVLSMAAEGFQTRHSVIIDAPRAAVYQALVHDIDKWWNPDYTVSGDSARLYVEPRALGCFCEVLGENASVVHLTVTLVNPGVMLRFSGGLGPLGLMGVSGNLTFEFDDIGDGSELVVQYAVGGYRPGGLDGLAARVDAVLVEAAERLKVFVEAERDAQATQ